MKTDSIKKLIQDLLILENGWLVKSNGRSQVYISSGVSKIDAEFSKLNV